MGRKPLPNPLPEAFAGNLSRKASAGNLSRYLFRKPLPGVFATSGYAKNRRCAGTLCSRNRQTHPTPSHGGFAFWLNLPLEIGHCWVPGGVRVGWGGGWLGAETFAATFAGCLRRQPFPGNSLGRLSRKTSPGSLCRKPLSENLSRNPCREFLPGACPGNLCPEPMPETSPETSTRGRVIHGRRWGRRGGPQLRPPTSCDARREAVSFKGGERRGKRMGRGGKGAAPHPLTGVRLHTKI